jgi:hypothetical protein
MHHSLAKLLFACLCAAQLQLRRPRLELYPETMCWPMESAGLGLAHWDAKWIAVMHWIFSLKLAGDCIGESYWSVQPNQI